MSGLSPHRLPDGLTAHLRRFKQHDHDDQMVHLRHAHDCHLASNETRHEVHRLLHEDDRSNAQHNDRIELTMPDTVTVILDMPEEDALSLQAMIDERTLNIANGFYADDEYLLVDNGKTKMKLSAMVRRVGSLPDRTPGDAAHYAEMPGG